MWRRREVRGRGRGRGVVGEGWWERGWREVWVGRVRA